MSQVRDIHGRPAGQALLPRLASCMLAFVVGLSAFWLGSNRPLAWAANGAALGLVVMLAAVAVWHAGRRHAPLHLRRVGLALALIAAGLLWGFVQIIELPPGRLTHPAWGLAQEALQRPLGHSISINPQETRWALLRWASAGAVLASAYCLAREPACARVMVNVALAMIVLAAVYGLARLSMPLDKVLWYDEPQGQYLTGSFINRNSAATYFGLGTLAALGVSCAAVQRQARGGQVQPLAAPALVPVAVLALMSMTVLVTGSRGAVVAVVPAALVLCAAMWATGSGRSWRAVPAWAVVVTAGLSIVAALVMLELAGSRLAGRFLEQGLESGSRLAVYGRALFAAGDHVWTGSGLGTFQDVFPAYRSDVSAADRVWDKAHNDYLELLIGLGLPASCLVLAGLAWLGGICLWALRTRRRNLHYPATGLAVLVFAGLHAMVDFSLQIQANALMLALLLGVGVAQSFSSRVPVGR